MPSNQTSVLDTPEGRVHINQSTGHPSRYVGDTIPPAAFYLPADSPLWEDIKWEDLSQAEQKVYRTHYPVV